MRTKSRVLTRRNAIVGLAAIGGGALFARETLLKAAATPPGGLLSGNACLLTPEAVEGPFYFDPKLVRADITEGKLGTPLNLTLQVVEAKDCAKRAGARVDIWHADALVDVRRPADVRAPYRDRQEARDTSNATDFIFKDEGGAQTLSSVAEKEGGFLASLLIGINRT